MDKLIMEEETKLLDRYTFPLEMDSWLTGVG